MPKLAILLAAYNGEAFLEEQLLSLQHQTCQDWCLYVVNDASTDNTLNMLEEFRLLWGEEKINIRSHANRGCTASFLSLVTDPAIHADYYAYCDHDDIWEPNKLEKALSILQQQRQDLPQLYCSSTQLINAAGKPIGNSTVYKRPPCFKNALVQNIASGNTMMFNHCAKELLSIAGIVDVPIHDWWTYILLTACHGQVHYDPQSFIKYRQHGQNLVGYGQSVWSQFKRLFKRNGYQFYHWNDMHIHCLESMQDKLSSEALSTLQAFKKSRQGNLFERLYWLYRSGVFGQTYARTLKLYMACLLGNL